jgi:hypothetical protein
MIMAARGTRRQPAESEISLSVALGDIDGDGSAPAVDADGLPNINPDGLLPDLSVDTII